MFLRSIPVRYEYRIGIDIFRHDVPRTATQSESLPLSYRMKPISLVKSQYLSGFELYYRPL